MIDASISAYSHPNIEHNKLRFELDLLHAGNVISMFLDREQWGMNDDELEFFNEEKYVETVTKEYFSLFCETTGLKTLEIVEYPTLSLTHPTLPHSYFENPYRIVGKVEVERDELRALYILSQTEPTGIAFMESFFQTTEGGYSSRPRQLQFNYDVEHLSTDYFSALLFYAGCRKTYGIEQGINFLETLHDFVCFAIGDKVESLPLDFIDWEAFNIKKYGTKMMREDYDIIQEAEKKLGKDWRIDTNEERMSNQQTKGLRM